MKVLLGTPGMKVSDMLVVDIPDPPPGMNESQFALRLARHLRFHELPLPMVANAFNVTRNRFGKLEIPAHGTAARNAQNEIQNLAVKYNADGAEDAVDQLAKTIYAMDRSFS
jgi:hypothetical protein